MSKKTLLLIIFLFIVTCGLLYIALVTPQYRNPAQNTPTPTPKSVNAKTTLMLAPSSTPSAASTYTLAATINTGVNTVNAVQLELSYDPQALTNVVVKSGDFFPQPNVLLNTINATDGRISYALTQPLDTSGKKGTGVIAYISFNLSPTFSGSTTAITFLPKTAVAADKILESVLDKATGYTVVIPTPAEQTSTTSAQ